MGINDGVLTIKVLKINLEVHEQSLPIWSLRSYKLWPCHHLFAQKFHPHWASSFSEQASSYLDAFLKYFPACFLGKNFDLRNKAIISLNSLNIPYIALLQLHISLCKHFSSVQFSCSVVFGSLQPHGLQHTRPPCPSPSPGAYSNSGALSQ